MCHVFMHLRPRFRVKLLIFLSDYLKSLKLDTSARDIYLREEESLCHLNCFCLSTCISISNLVAHTAPNLKATNECLVSVLSEMKPFFHGDIKPQPLAISVRILPYKCTITAYMHIKNVWLCFRFFRYVDMSSILI